MSNHQFAAILTHAWGLLTIGLSGMTWVAAVITVLCGMFQLLTFLYIPRP